MSGTAEMVTIAEAAARLQVDPKTVRRWIAEGLLTGYRLGPALIRLDPAEVNALLRPIPAATAARPHRVRVAAPLTSRAQQVCTGHALFSVGEDRWTVPLFAAPQSSPMSGSVK